MAEPVNFPEANTVWKGWPSDETRPEVADLPAHRHELGTVSCWKLTDEEKAEVARTGVVWLHVFGNQHPPVAACGTSPFLPPAPAND